ncbi:MAG: hypothetical protein JNN30_05615 [Rhodanobacteraceae bacterium]|nr:hypothetical protein [Rhodanobacteraceae bacterium]
MSSSEHDHRPTATQPEAVPGRVSFERLRERTDELELLISGLTLLALLTLPGWLQERFGNAYAVLPFGLLAAASMTVPMAIAICYTLAAGFVLHLGVRAYWVGLIGLKAVFPAGVNWSRSVTLGPIRREQLQQTLPRIDSSIDRADRLASLLFSLNLLAGVALSWIGLLAVLVFIVAGLLGAEVGAANRYVNVAIQGFFNLMLLAALSRWVLDALLAGRFPTLRRSAAFRGLVWLVTAVTRVYFPDRLLALLRLTLQSNTRPRLFAFAFLFVMLLAPLVGAIYFQRSADFDPLRTLEYIGDAEVRGGARSAHYETQRTTLNRRRGEPMIPAPVIETGWLPLFLPYQALRDDVLLRLRCPELVAARKSGGLPVPGRERSKGIAECLGRLWQVQLNGRVLALDRFFVSERSDLGFRGLSGYIDLRSEVPGLQWLRVIWRPGPEQETLVSDLVGPGSLHYNIPFLWSPEAAYQGPPPSAAQPVPAGQP